MKTPKRIILPKSGITLRLSPMIGDGGIWNYIDYRALVGGLQLRIYQGTEGRWYASTPGGGHYGYATLAGAKVALDREVVVLREALNATRGSS